MMDNVKSSSRTIAAMAAIGITLAQLVDQVARVADALTRTEDSSDAPTPK